MSIFTDVAAALSFNFGDESMMPKSHHDHVRQKDRTKEQKEYLKYLRKKVGIECVAMEMLSNYIIRYREEHNGEVSLKEISAKTYADKKDLKKALKWLTKYENKKQKQQENIDYIINNPSPTLTSQNVNSNAENDNSNKETDSIDSYDIMNGIIWTLMDDPLFQPCIELLQTKGIQENEIPMVSAQVMKNMVNADPELYDKFRNILLTSIGKNVKPFIVNGQQFELNTLYTNLINNLETHAGTAQAPSSITEDTVRSDDDQVLSKDDGINLVQQIIMDVIRSDPSLYKNFREALLGSCSKVIQPIVTNGQ